MICQEKFRLDERVRCFDPTLGKQASSGGGPKQQVMMVAVPRNQELRRYSNGIAAFLIPESSAAKSMTGGTSIAPRAGVLHLRR